ncbi:MAG: biopolymer transporter ExbD [Pirellulales bacterium]
MRLPNHLLRRDRSLEISLTPMIDVVFQLMIFFVWTASFEIPERLLPTTVSLPRGNAAALELPPELRDLERIVIKVYWRNEQPAWQLNDVESAGLVEIQDKLTAVAAISADLPVLIDPQDSVPLEHVIRTYDTARHTGFRRIQLAAGSPLRPTAPPR